MAIVYTVGEIKNNIKIYTEQGWTIVIFQPCSVYILMLFLISPTVYTIAIFQPCSVYILIWRDKKNNIKIYTEQDWKMAIVYTVGEIRNNIKIIHRTRLEDGNCIRCWRDKK
jgi:hypothetical protein